jgi:tryptophan-rich sensory protein
MKKWIKFIASILICQIAGIIGSIFTTSSIITWYVRLNKPWFTPPNWLFGPVWITLYILMGISLYLIWNKNLEIRKIKTPLILFFVQLTLNALWSLIFFGLQSKFYGLIEIIILWISITFTIFSFSRVSKKAAMLLVPYIAWVSIATLLNYYVWILN